METAGGLIADSSTDAPVISAGVMVSRTVRIKVSLSETLIQTQVETDVSNEEGVPRGLHIHVSGVTDDN